MSHASLTIVGYWRQTKDETSDLPWPEATSATNAAWLAQAAFRKHLAWLETDACAFRAYGYSMCRLCGKQNGNAEYVHYEMGFRWPEGLRHYLEEHFVLAPQSLVDRVTIQA